MLKNINHQQSTPKSKKILVTETAGFIGFNLAKVANSDCEANFPRKKLLEHGGEVVGLDNINDYYDVNLKYKEFLGKNR